MANFGPLTAEIGSGVWAPQQLSTVSRLGFVKAKFHNSSWFLAGSKLVRSRFGAGSELKFGLSSSLLAMN